MSESSFSAESLRKIAEQKINYRYSVLIHVAAFILVNTLLFFINILTFPSYYWFLLPLLAWNIGVVLHAVSYVLYARGVYPSAKRGVIYHLFAYLTDMTLLFVINMNLMADFTFRIMDVNWVYFPAVFWGLALLLHYIVYRIYLRGDITKEGVGISRRQKMIEKEMQKMKNKPQ